MADYGISTLGITLYYGAGTNGARPTTNSGYTQLHRINAIGGITAEPEVIDASALEDDITHNIKGRTTVSDTVSITVNLTTESLKEWNTLISSYSETNGMWFQVYYDGKITDGATTSAKNQSFYFKAQPPATIPMPESNQNELQTVEIPLVVESVEGYAEAKIPS